MARKEGRLLRIGVLGCGPIAQFAHFDACRKARNVELYALCDAAEDLLARMAQVHRPTVTYPRYESMLEDPQVEAVLIATADAYHVPLARQAIDAGKHVFVEKPMGVAVEECEGLVQCVHSSGLRLQVGTNKRFDPGIAHAHAFVQQELGGLIAYKGWYCDSTRRYAMTDNLQPLPVTSESVRRPAGNPKADKRRYFMLAHGSHMVDTARFLAGPIEAVHARLVERYNSYCWFVDATFANGAVGHLDLTIPLRGDFQEGFRIYGEHGSVEGRVHLPWFHKSSEVECYSDRDGTYRRVLGEDAYTYKLQLEGFADAILHGKPTQGATVDDGAAAVRTMAAIARSVESGKEIALSDVSGDV